MYLTLTTFSSTLVVNCNMQCSKWIPGSSPHWVKWDPKEVWTLTTDFCSPQTWWYLKPKSAWHKLLKSSSSSNSPFGASVAEFLASSLWQQQVDHFQVMFGNFLVTFYLPKLVVVIKILKTKKYNYLCLSLFWINKSQCDPELHSTQCKPWCLKLETKNL